MRLEVDQTHESISVAIRGPADDLPAPTSMLAMELVFLTHMARLATRAQITANGAMWSIFEPELRTRLHELDACAGYRERVRACLMETMAGGECSMADVAKRQTVSPRTLQRKPADEGTTFQRELNNRREELARHYLATSRYFGAEISFLLGCQDPNSFFRAIHG